MPRPFPRALRLPLHAVETQDGLANYIYRRLNLSASKLPYALHAYAFKNDERDFACRLLSTRTQFWLFRTRQTAACGDFMVVDLSIPSPRQRHAWVIELKQGRSMRVFEGGWGYQLRHAPEGLGELSTKGVLAENPAFSAIVGDSHEVLSFFGAGFNRDNAHNALYSPPPAVLR